MEPLYSDNKLRAILMEAHKAAQDAVIGGHDRGACGFAWVIVDGQHPLARYCRKMLKQSNRMTYETKRMFGAKGYPKGWQFWKPGGFPGQAVDTHEQGALAFRDVLGKYNIRADMGSRLD